MPTIDSLNPFARRETHTQVSITTYKVLTSLSWLLAVIVSVYYCLHRPHDDLYHRKIWDINRRFPTAFSLNSTITSIYWAVLFVSQIGYVTSLFSSSETVVSNAASVGSHFIFHNLFHFLFVMLFVRGHWILAEIVLILNFLNLTSLYFRHNTYPHRIHFPAVSGPLAFTFVAIYWNGAIMVYHPGNLIARIFGNVFIWSILVYGLFFIFAYKDYTMGFNLSVLAASIGVAQFLGKIIALQWIFAFTIMAILFVFTLIVAVPAWQGKEFEWRRAAPADTERAPLLGDE